MGQWVLISEGPYKIMDTHKAQESLDQIDAILTAIACLLNDVPVEAPLARKWIKSAEFELGRARIDIIMQHNERLLKF